MKGYERNDLGSKARNLERGPECLDMGVVLLWGEKRLLGTSLCAGLPGAWTGDVGESREGTDGEAEGGEKLLGSCWEAAGCFRQWLQASFQRASPEGGTCGYLAGMRGSTGEEGLQRPGAAEEHSRKG